MKKSLLLLVVAIFTLTTAFEASAKWTDRNTFGLNGPVKTVDNGYGDIRYSFYKDGSYKSDRAILSYDEYGRIKTIEVYSLEGMGSFVHEYTYNSKGQVIKDAYTTGNGDDCTTEYKYDAKGRVIKETNDWGETRTYTYLKFDSYGNWIKRTVINGKNKSTESRKITYYK